MPTARTLADRALQIAGNALPLIGTVLFGWGVVPTVFMIWLDTLFCNLHLSAMILASAARVVPMPIEGAHVGAQRVGARLGAGVVAVSFCSPSLAAGFGIWQLLERQVTRDSLAALLTSLSFYLWILIEMAWGARRVASTYAGGGYRDAEDMRAAGGVRLVNICNRCAVLLALAWCAQWLGRFGLVAFVMAATCFVTYVEMHDDWVARMQAKVEAAGRAYRARKQRRGS